MMRNASFIGLCAAIVLSELAFLSLAKAQISASAQPTSPSPQAMQPIVGPAPAWVTRQRLPPDDLTTHAEAPVRVLLQDQQISFEPGRRTIYSEIAVKIQNPAGLGAGNISVPWRPETDVLTVHTLQVLRGDEVIDVLASGQTFSVLRREQNLENAVLDGVLTANIQPEGLQVGDLLVFAASVTTSDPVFRGHVELVAASEWNFGSVARGHLSVEWPQSMHIDHRFAASMPAARVTRRAGLVRVDVTIDNVEPFVAPSGAPPRFAFGRLAEFSSFSSWGELASLFAPLYTRAAELSAHGPLRDEVERIRASSADPVVRAQAALTLVQDRVRYLALAMGQGGLVPADAATTWARRFGDCKAKTALLIAILRELDIEAEPVAVSSLFGDGLDQRLPMIGLFDHVLVRATIGSKVYFLDGTRTGDTNLQNIETPAFGWGLPLTTQANALIRMIPEPAALPYQQTSTRIDLSAGLIAPARIRVEYVLRGDAAIADNLTFSSMSPDLRDRTLREYWRRLYRDLEINSTSVSFDASRREQTHVMDGHFDINFRRDRYRVQAATLGYRGDFNREPKSPSEAPFAVSHPQYQQKTTTILLPQGGFQIERNEAVNTTIAGMTYRRQASIDGTTFVVTASAQSVAPEFPASEAPAAKAALTALADRDVVLLRPDDYLTTDADLEALGRDQPKDAASFLRRGNTYLDSGRFDQAIADFDSAAALEPRNVFALANRGFASVWKGDTPAATRDLDAAAAIDPNNIVIHRARGLIAQNGGANADAIAAFSRALSIDSDDLFSLSRRAEVYFAMREFDSALVDAAAALQLLPSSPDLHLLRANVFFVRGDKSSVAAEADRLAGQASSADAHLVAANIYSAAGRREQAMAEFDRAIALSPESYMFLNRAMARPLSDLVGRRADIEEALRLEPQSSDALQRLAELFVDERDYDGAASAWTQALLQSPEDVHFLARRGAAFMLSGRPTLANADFMAARRLADSASQFNTLCWARVTANVTLDAALEDCNTALAMSPDHAATLDSRALIYLRLGRLDEAIADYDRALATAPRQASSLYARGIARDLKGEQARADADKGAAIAIDPEIAAKFDRHGLTNSRPPQ